MLKLYKPTSRRQFLVTGANVVTGYAALNAMVGCASANFERGTTRSVSIELIMQEIRTGNYKALMTGVSPKIPQVIFLGKINSPYSFRDRRGEFDPINVSRDKLEKIVENEGSVDFDNGGTEFAIRGTVVGYVIPICPLCDVEYNSKTNQFEISAAGGDISGGAGGAGAGAGAGGAGGSCCFPRGTKITMSDNSIKNIEDVRIGEEVISFDVKSKDTKPAKVLELEAPVREGYFDLNDGLLKLTDEHPIFARQQNGKEGWASLYPEKTLKESTFDEVLKLEQGDQVFNLNTQASNGLSSSTKQWVKIKKIEFVEGGVQTFNLKAIEQQHTFFADGVLVHNKM